MRQFFIDALTNLKEIAGINQLEIMLKEAQNDKDAFKAKFQFLINELTATSSQFSQFPEAEQQKAIREAIMNDKDFKNLNVRWLFQLLVAKNKEYAIRVADEKRKEEEREIRDSKGIPYEQAKPYIEELKKLTSCLTMNIERGPGLGERLKKRFEK